MYVPTCVMHGAEALNKFFIYSQKTGNDEYRRD